MIRRRAQIQPHASFLDVKLTGEQTAEELADGGGELGVAAVRREVHLPADRHAVHVDLHEQAALARALAGAASLGAAAAVLMLSGRRLGRLPGGPQVPPERPHRRPPHHRSSSCWPGPDDGF